MFAYKHALGWSDRRGQRDACRRRGAARAAADRSRLKRACSAFRKPLRTDARHHQHARRVRYAAVNPLDLRYPAAQGPIVHRRRGATGVALR